MTEKTKNVLLGVLIVGLVSMTVAYAALTQTLNINGSATVQNISQSWHVRFRALDSTKDGSTYTAITPTQYATLANDAALSFTSDSTIVTLPAVTLKAPGDKVEFVWVVENTGDINAILTGKTDITLGAATWGQNETLDATAKQALIDDIDVTFTYADGTAITANSDTLAKTTGKAYLKVKIEYVKDTVNAQTLPSQDVTFSSITAALTYGQDSNS